MADDFQPLLIEIAVEPKSTADREKLGHALAKLAFEDSSFQASTDQESGQTIIKGTSENHLAGKVAMLKGTFGIDARIGVPQVAFRERPTRRAETEYTYKKILGAGGQFASVRLVIEPNKPGAGYEFSSSIEDDELPKSYIPGVEKGIESVLMSGVVAGFPVVDVRVELADAKYHDVDSSPLAFEIASRVAFREALQKAMSVLLEPIMRIEVATPENIVDSIIKDLRSRRGHISGQQTGGNANVVNATVPLMAMFGYDDALLKMSEGRATFSMQFDHYAPAPPNSGNDPPFRPAIGMRA